MTKRPHPNQTWTDKQTGRLACVTGAWQTTVAYHYCDKPDWQRVCLTKQFVRRFKEKKL